MPIDYNKYPKNWKTEIVPRILKRANNKCEICGLENHQKVYSYEMCVKTISKNHQKTVYKNKKFWCSNESDWERIKNFSNKHKVVEVILTIAHLDHDSENENVSDNRLMAMCQYCHLNYDAMMKWKKHLISGNETR